MNEAYNLGVDACREAHRQLQEGEGAILNPPAWMDEIERLNWRNGWNSQFARSAAEEVYYELEDEE